MKRRHFIQSSSLAALSSLFVANRSMAAFNPKVLNSCAGVNDRILVLIRLDGGNDGLNTIIPIDQYSDYANLRPTIKIPDTGLDAYINLDTTLAVQNQVGLHPNLTGLKSMYDDGFMGIVQGVSYPYQNRSHFKSTDLWMTGGDGTPANNTIKSGWVARYLENTFPGAVGNPNIFDSPLALQLGEKKPAVLFHSEHEHGISANMSGQDLAGYYSVVSGVGGAPITNIPASEHGDMLRYIMDIEKNANVYSQKISTCFNAGSNNITYPQHDLADQLKTVAKLISGGLNTKIYLVNLGGFDTHNLQIDPTLSVTQGRHGILMQALSESVKAFFDDIKAQGLQNRVMAVSFSEFGRKIQENGNYGTDHGGISSMFVFGKGVEAGVKGTNVDLSEASSSNNYQLTTQQHDYRQVFATLLQDWLGADNSIVDTALFDNNASPNSFTNQKLGNLINQSYTVDPLCYVNTLVNVHNPTKAVAEIQLYPNPATSYIQVQFLSPLNGELRVYNLNGQIMRSIRLENSAKEIISLQGWPAGNYVATFLQQGKKHFSQSFTVQ